MYAIVRLVVSSTRVKEGEKAPYWKNCPQKSEIRLSWISSVGRWSDDIKVGAPYLEGGQVHCNCVSEMAVVIKSKSSVSVVVSTIVTDGHAILYENRHQLASAPKDEQI